MNALISRSTPKMWLRKHSHFSICLLSMSVMFPPFALRGYGQISLVSSVKLALSNDPRIRMAESDVARARASLQEARDAFIPSVTGSSSGAGYSYGFPLGVPTVFSFSAQSLVLAFRRRTISEQLGKALPPAIALSRKFAKTSRRIPLLRTSRSPMISSSATRFFKRQRMPRGYKR